MTGFTCLTDPTCETPPYESFTISRRGEITSFNPFDAPSSFASGVNPSGTVVGTYTDSGGVTHGYQLCHGKFTSNNFPVSYLPSMEELIPRETSSASTRHVQGKHRYYSLEGPNVARALESLSVIAGRPQSRFVPNTPGRLRVARTCYDHIAGTLGVALHDRFQALGWLASDPATGDAYDLTPHGTTEFSGLGIDLSATRALRRRFAYACLDWSERRPHVGGALGAAILEIALKRKWVLQDLDSRSLGVTGLGRREMRARFGLTS